MFRLIPLALLLFVMPAGQQTPLPVLDMHLHAGSAGDNGPPPVGICTSPTNLPTRDPARPWGVAVRARVTKPPCDNPVWSPTTDAALLSETVAVMRQRNIYGVLSGSIEDVAAWQKAAPGRFIKGHGFEVGSTKVTPEEMRARFRDRRIEVLAEVTNQYSGVSSGDPRFEPYLAAAEEFDIPVGIHVGTGPVGAPYLAWPAYRASLHSALTLEEPLLRHPKLRVYAMHAGWPMLDDMLAVLYAHPQLHVEVGVIIWNLPKAEFYRYLQRIVDAGFGKRVMFGSDQMVWPGVIERAIQTIETAPFLTPEQKRDILYHNAARFLRLSEAEIARHHAGR